MFKKILAVVLILLLITAPALAEVYTGLTFARSLQAITAPASSEIDRLYVQSGYAVEEGDAIARLRTTKVFASQDGTIARIQAEEGKEENGTILELSPVSRYTVHCSSGEAYDSIQSNLVHCGETLYLYCTYNGTHQGTGRVYSIDGSTYMMEATGGEFYVGETVYIYRDADHRYKYLVGTGTVVPSATELYESEGMVAKIHVSEGEYVERGELLYEIVEGEEMELSSATDGIIIGCEVQEGDKVTQEQLIASLVPYEEILVSFQMEEERISQLSIGEQVALNYACDGEDVYSLGEIIRISHLGEDGTYTVWIDPEVQPAYLGMTVLIRTSE